MASQRQIGSQANRSNEIPKLKSNVSRQPRQMTPDRPLIQGGESRDELAGTRSHHNGRRKRPLEEDPEDDNDGSASPSPPKAMKSNAQSLPKASKVSTKSVMAASQPPPKASKVSTKSVMAASQPPPKASKASTKSFTAASQPLPKASKPPWKPATHPPVTKPTNTTLKASAGNARHAVNAEDDGSSSGEERSRSNSTTTLMPGSNSHSQMNGLYGSSNSQGQINGNETVVEVSTAIKKSKVKSQAKSEATALMELNMLSRRYFLAFLSNTFTDEPIRAVFPGMKSDHHVYKDAKYRVQRSYKTWKSEVLKWALQWVQRWIKSAPGRRRQDFLHGLSTFAELKAEVRKEYEPKWLEGVFRFGIEAVDFETITADGLPFLKYAFLQLVTHSRLTELHLENPGHMELVKYTRKHLLDMFEALHLKSEFERQSIDDYPERTVPRALQYKKRPKVDMNVDSDGTIGESDEDGNVEHASDAGLGQASHNEQHHDEDLEDCGNSGY